MKLLPSNHDYLLDMFQHKEDGDEIWIGWRYYGDSTHFLVISCSALHPVTLDDIPNLMKELKVSDSDLLNGGDSGKLNSSENSRHIFLISQRKYLQNERGFKVSKHILSEGKAIPLKIMVFACLVDEKNEISVLR